MIAELNELKETLKIEVRREGYTYNYLKNSAVLGDVTPYNPVEVRRRFRGAHAFIIMAEE
jgi:hypothetical protein